MPTRHSGSDAPVNRQTDEDIFQADWSVNSSLSKQQITQMKKKKRKRRKLSSLKCYCKNILLLIQWV